MDRLACVNVIDLPLQLLLRRQPDWQDAPVVVVDRDQPNGCVQWTNKYARRARIRPGMRYGQALSLRHDLKAGCVADSEVDDCVETLAMRLQDYTPVVEAARDQPGIFWLDASGLDRLFGSFERWAKALAEGLLDQEGLYTTVVVGFGRFGTWAVAGAKRGGLVIFEEPGEQRRCVRRVPLDALHLAPELREALAKLGVVTIADLLGLPADGVRRRFGDQAYELYRRARGDLKMPLSRFEADEQPVETLDLEAAEADSTRLVFLIKRYLHPLLSELESRQDKLVRLEVLFVDERDAPLRFEVRPASPTVDQAQIVDLLRLRLESLELKAGVVEVELCAHTTNARQEQLHMFVGDQKRDLADANQALARVRAEFGDQAVVYAQLADAHLPEARFRWEPLTRLQAPRADKVEIRPLIRRIRRRPVPLSGLGFDPEETDAQMAGPFVISGGWWLGGVHRNYHFVEGEDGEIVWVYWDDDRQRWFRHGEIE